MMASQEHGFTTHSFCFGECLKNKNRYVSILCTHAHTGTNEQTPQNGPYAYELKQVLSNDYGKFPQLLKKQRKYTIISNALS